MNENGSVWNRKTAGRLLLYGLLATVFYGLTRLRYESGQRQFSLRAYGICLFFVMGTCLLHEKNKGERTAATYIKTLLFGSGKGKNRILYMDWLRILAAVLVIADHVIEPAYQQMEARGPAWSVLISLSSVFHCSNLLFLMISGALILNGKEEPVWTFYKKRFLKVAVPCFAYYCFYYFYTYGIFAFAPGRWLELLGSFTANSTGMSPHFWLIHVILVFYITAPFLSVMVKHMSEEQTAALAAVIFAMHFVYTYGPYYQVNFVASTFFASWESMFLLGYFCTTKTAMKYYRLILTGGFLSVLFMIYTVHTTADFVPLLYNNAPPMLLAACALFLFFRKHGDSLFSRISPAMEAVSKYSFSILMIHWCILFLVVEKRVGINGLSFGIVGGTVLSVGATLVLSLIFAILYDNSVVLCVDWAVRMILELPGKMIRTLRISHRPE